MPTWHTVHCDEDEAPVTFANVPATQFVQLTALVLQVPTLHIKHWLEPAADQEPAEQPKHCNDEDAARAVEYVPTTQFVQLTKLDDQVPGLHAEHELDPVDDQVPVEQP